MLPPPVSITLFCWQHRRIPKRAAKKEASSAGFWQLPCPHPFLADSLNFRRHERGWVGPSWVRKSKKMGKSRNFNRKLRRVGTEPRWFYMRSEERRVGKEW